MNTYTIHITNIVKMICSTLVVLCSCSSSDDILDINTYTTDYNDTITLRQKSVTAASMARVRIAMYETIPGYDVTDIVFYYVDSNGERKSSGWEEGVVVAHGLSDNVCNTDLSCRDTQFSFGRVLSVDGEYASNIQTLGHSASDPSWIGGEYDPNDTYYNYVQVSDDGKATMLTMHVDFTLRSASGDIVTISNAVLPLSDHATRWAAGGSYTYFVKISQEVDGHTGDIDTPNGLLPITFDACVVEENTEMHSEA